MDCKLVSAVPAETTSRRARDCRPETEAKYRRGLEIFATTRLSYAEISRQCGYSLAGFTRYICTYHRHLMLERNGIRCAPAEAASIKINQRRGQRPATRAKYKDAIAACDSMEYIACNVSEIARKFGLSGSNLAGQLRMHYPEVLEFRERARQLMGLDDGLPRGTRQWCRQQYADAVELLRSDPYISMREAARRCNVSYTGLERYLVSYHKDLVDNRIVIRGNALRRKLKGEITGRGTVHEPSPAITEKYAAALQLYRTTPLSARKIAVRTGVSAKGFYEYLHTWHKDLIRKGKGNPATAAKYAGAISRLRQGGVTPAEVAAELGLHPDTLRHYLKAHEPQLLRQSMMRGI